MEPPKEERRVLDMAQGGVKDNVGDEMNEAGARGTAQGGHHQGSEAACLRGVKDNVQDEFDGSQEERH